MAFRRGLPADKLRKAWTVPAVCPTSGRPLCRWCNQPVTEKRRQTFCSEACVHEWKMRSNAQYVRRKVEARDRGVCGLCGIQCASRRRWHRRPEDSPPPPAWEADHIVPLVEGGSYGLENLRTLCVPCHKLETAALARRRAQGKIPQ